MTIENLIHEVEALLLTVSHSSVPLLRETSQHILAAGGKRLRPRLVLLAHQAVGGQNIQEVIPLAAAVEIIHTATLVHDDINDHGTLRRGRETVNFRWGRTFALLTGDFMFTRAYELMAPFNSDLNAVLARAATRLVEGETLQIHASKRGVLDPEIYFQIIGNKTAALFVASVELGSMVADAPQEWIDALRDYAFNLGLAFQITDDVLDLVADAQQLGKNTMVDIAQGRGIAVAMQGDGSPALHTAAVGVDNGGDTSGNFFKHSVLYGQGVDEVVSKGREKAQELADVAVSSLDVLPPSPALDELRKLAGQIVNRDH